MVPPLPRRQRASSIAILLPRTDACDSPMWCAWRPPRCRPPVRDRGQAAYHPKPLDGEARQQVALRTISVVPCSRVAHRLQPVLLLLPTTATDLPRSDRARLTPCSVTPERGRVRPIANNADIRCPTGRTSLDAHLFVHGASDRAAGSATCPSHPSNTPRAASAGHLPRSADGQSHDRWRRRPNEHH